MLIPDIYVLRNQLIDMLMRILEIKQNLIATLVYPSELNQIGMVSTVYSTVLS